MAKKTRPASCCCCGLPTAGGWWSTGHDGVLVGVTTRISRGQTKGPKRIRPGDAEKLDLYVERLSEIAEANEHHAALVRAAAAAVALRNAPAAAEAEDDEALEA